MDLSGIFSRLNKKNNFDLNEIQTRMIGVERTCPDHIDVCINRLLFGLAYLSTLLI